MLSGPRHRTDRSASSDRRADLFSEKSIGPPLATAAISARRMVSQSSGGSPDPELLLGVQPNRRGIPCAARHKHGHEFVWVRGLALGRGKKASAVACVSVCKPRPPRSCLGASQAGQKDLGARPAGSTTQGTRTLWLGKLTSTRANTTVGLS